LSITSTPLVPAKAGTQGEKALPLRWRWIPAFAGMSGIRGGT